MITHNTMLGYFGFTSTGNNTENITKDVTKDVTKNIVDELKNFHKNGKLKGVTSPSSPPYNPFRPKNSITDSDIWKELMEKREKILSKCNNTKEEEEFTHVVGYVPEEEFTRIMEHVPEEVIRKYIMEYVPEEVIRKYSDRLLERERELVAAQETKLVHDLVSCSTISQCVLLLENVSEDIARKCIGTAVNRGLLTKEDENRICEKKYPKNESIEDRIEKLTNTVNEMNKNLKMTIVKINHIITYVESIDSAVDSALDSIDSVIDRL